MPTTSSSHLKQVVENISSKGSSFRDIHPTLRKSALVSGFVNKATQVLISQVTSIVLE
jgi:hypothetical protein